MIGNGREPALAGARGETLLEVKHLQKLYPIRRGFLRNFSFAPREELHRRQRTRSGPSGWPPRASGTMWSAVRSRMLPHLLQYGWAAMVARASRW